MIRAAAAALIGALASAVWLALFYAAGGGLRIGFDVDPPRVVSGFHPAERDDNTGLAFAWTGAEAAIRLAGIDRRMPWTLTVRVRNAGAPARPAPLLTFYVDGIQLHTYVTKTDFEDVRVLVPARPERRGVTIVMRSSATFVPGPDDRRELGVMVDRLTLSPGGLVLPPAHVFGKAMIAGAVLAGAIALLGVTSGSAVGSAVLVGAGQGAVLGRGFAPYTTFPDVAARVAIAIGVVLAITAASVRWRQRMFRNTARFAIAFTACALFLKLLVLLHPDMPLGDALFQAHRFQGVLSGNVYFTSIAPGGYAFPYAPGLYIVAAPFAGLVRRELGDVMLLRIVTAAADAGAGLLLYFIVARRRAAVEAADDGADLGAPDDQRGGRALDRLAGAFAVALYHLMPLSFRILTVGNLTNAFAQSLSVGALATMTAPSLRSIAGGVTLTLTLMLTAAFLSHTSTFAILSVTVFFTAALFFVKGGRSLRTGAAALTVAAVISIALAVGLYYAHFVPTYRAEMARLGAETATAAPDAGGRGVLERASAVPRYLNIYFGLPALLLAVAGVVERRRQRAHDRVTLAIAGLGLTCVLFLLFGVLTPLDMRYYLAVIPALALLAAAGASWWWKSGGAARLAAAALLAWAVWIGVETWWSTIS